MPRRLSSGAGITSVVMLFTFPAGGEATVSRH
jgi:hypothetical protein